MTHKQVEEYILSMPSAKLDYPFGEDVAVYKFIPTENVESKKRNPNASNEDRGKMFALIREGKEPVQISLKCDPQLAVLLRDKYETVMQGYHLNKKHWNTIVLTGQIPWEEIQGFIRHSYDLVVGNKNAIPEVN